MPSAACVARLRAKNRHCYVCGTENPTGFHVPFSPDGPNGCRAEYTARVEHNGWPGVQHGGATFTLMDEALGWAIHFQGLNGLTAKAEARFVKPIPTGARLIIRGWTMERRRHWMTARAEIRLDDEAQTLLAETDATMRLFDGEVKTPSTT